MQIIMTSANCSPAEASPVELELELILSRWLWEGGEKGGASLQNQARVRAPPFSPPSHSHRESISSSSSSTGLASAGLQLAEVIMICIRIIQHYTRGRFVPILALWRASCSYRPEAVHARKVFGMLPDFPCISWACVFAGDGPRRGYTIKFLKSQPAEAEQLNALPLPRRAH